MMNSTKIIVSAVFFVLIYFASAGGSDAETVSRSAYKVSKLTCGSCLKKIQDKLITYKGMIGMKANLAKGIILVDHSPYLKNKMIEDAITNLGYPAKLLGQTDIDIKDVISEKNRFSGGCSGGTGRCCGGTASSYEALRSRFLKWKERSSNQNKETEISDENNRRRSNETNP